MKAVTKRMLFLGLAVACAGAGYVGRAIMEPIKPAGDIRTVLAACDKVARECTALIGEGRVSLLVKPDKYGGTEIWGRGETIEEAAADVAHKSGILAKALAP